MSDNDSLDFNGIVRADVGGGNALFQFDTTNLPVHQLLPPNQTPWGDHNAINVATHFSPRWAVLGDHRDKTRELAPKENEDHGAPVREPPAWKLDCKLGRGTFGTVFLERVGISGTGFTELWAVKRIPLDLPNFPTKQYQAEIKNLRALSNHEWFVKFYSSFEDTNYAYIAMEYIPIGDMSKTFVNSYRWNESDTRVVIEQLLHGLAVMHKAGITHRDLKPENIFLCLTDNETHALRVKIGDFGTSKHIPLSDASTYLKTTTGTVGYMAPEVQDTSKPKTNSVDIWSIGCILYRMVAGRPLFKDILEVLMYSITASSPPLAVHEMGLSAHCADFLRDVLQPSPKDRPSADVCLKKAWIMSKDPGSGYSIGFDLYSRLSKIKLEVPRSEPRPDAAVNLAAGVYGNATRGQPARKRVRTEPLAPDPTYYSNSSVNIFAGNPPFFDGVPIFGEPQFGTPSPASTEPDVYDSPVREPPAWKLNYQIGSGSFGTVFLEKVQIRGMEYPELWAVKQLPRAVPNFHAKRYENEIRSLKALSNHDWFVKFNFFYEDEHYVYIAMEYIPLGDMSKTFAQGYRWSEGDTKVVIRQLLHGLAVMHKEGITHRDLKPENIFLCLPEDQAFVLRVKIGDFGASKRIIHSSSSTCLRTTTGTDEYMAPEMDDTDVIKTNKVDIWSLGCILYRMVAGGAPFRGRSKVLQYAITGSSPPEVVKNRGFSIACKDFLRDVLQPNPMDRLSAEVCLKTGWIMSTDPGLEYSIGLDLYSRLSKMKLEVPRSEPRPDAAVNLAAGAYGNAMRGQPARKRIRTEPIAQNPTYYSNSSVNNFAGNPPFYDWESIFEEPQRGTPSPASTEPDVYDSPVREPSPWKLNYEIGSGSFGIVFLEKVQICGIEYPKLWAVKQLSKGLPNFRAKQYVNEIRNLQVLSNHDWFVKFNTSYEDEHYVYIAMEYIPLGDMSKTFAQGYRWNEGDTKVVIQQLLHGLAVMHKEGITHRDLKPENIFLCLPEDQALVLRVKIGDFGASKRIIHSSSSTYLRTTVGTQDYMAPEMDDPDVIKTNKVDIWSLGCILYRMVAGSAPFRSRHKVLQYAITGSSPPEVVKTRSFSIFSEDFLRDVLQPNPMDRLSAEACLKMAWITNKPPGSEYSIGRDLYNRLSRINLAAPDIDTLSDMAAHRAANITPARSQSTYPTLVTPR